jgi:hypothetical protein
MQHMQSELNNKGGVCSPEENHEEANMPVILLWVGLPVLLLGGGYFIVQSMN